MRQEIIGSITIFRLVMVGMAFEACEVIKHINNSVDSSFVIKYCEEVRDHFNNGIVYKHLSTIAYYVTK